MTCVGNKTLRPQEHPELYVEAILMKTARLPLTHKHIAVLLGVSAGRVWQIEQHALEKIRDCAKREGVLA
ncbi:MAG: sigma factor-like helix-turn-helix DNA-binding protein [Phycisphaerales bacterium]